MPKRDCSSLYFADDNDIFDLISSAKQHLTETRLIRLARQSGACFSMNSSRDELACEISLLPHDWFRLQQLLEETESEDRAERTTNSTLSISPSSAQINTAFNQLKTLRSEKRNEVYQLAFSGSSAAIHIGYSEIDHSKTRLNQRRPRDITIQIEHTPNGLVLRHEANARADEIVADLGDALAEAAQTTVLRREIEMKAIPDAKLRTQFFEDLMWRMPGFHLEDVSNVHVDLAASPDIDSSIEEQEDGDDTARELNSQDKKAIGILKKAILQGGGLLHSTEFQRLIAAGFYISHAVWTSLESAEGGVRVEFEAGFADSPNAYGFRYAVRGIHARTNSGELRKTRSHPDEALRARLISTLEETAQTSLKRVVDIATAPPGVLSELSDAADITAGMATPPPATSTDPTSQVISEPALAAEVGPDGSRA